MFAIQIDGLEETEARFDAYPAALVAALAAKASELAAALADLVRNDKLSGEVLNERTGALKASIMAEASADGGEVVASVGSVGEVKYAAIQEYGGKAGAPRFCPQRRGRSLSSLAAGCASRARSSIPARSFPNDPICAPRSTT